jgi:hypothetical protein
MGNIVSKSRLVTVGVVLVSLWAISKFGKGFAPKLGLAPQP